ncbi:hypothetical protein [Bradyrhizobium sp. WSM2254]|uniref:hypothetical protein n=1 Tax=Bradyrhizobium sp. WSM2254 TaxID=1188263 RepID=UPI00042230C4|nr:hypothetical protein [Bradyrhizobium sp. WSM2254]
MLLESREPIGRKYFDYHRLADLSDTELVIYGRNSVVPGGSSVSRYQLRQPFADMDILVRPIARGHVPIMGPRTHGLWLGSTIAHEVKLAV